MTTTTVSTASLPARAPATTTTSASSTQPGRAARYAGRALSGLAIAFLAFDAAMKIGEHPAVAEGSAKLGMNAAVAFPLGLVLAACTILYAIPRTAVLGAILLTGYLGGAVFAQLRIDAPLFSATLFPIYFACFVWAGLVLRNPGVRAVVLGESR